MADCNYKYALNHFCFKNELRSQDEKKENSSTKQNNWRKKKGKEQRCKCEEGNKHVPFLKGKNKKDAIFNINIIFNTITEDNTTIKIHE